MAHISLIQGEGKLLPFRIKDRATGKAMDLSGARFMLWVKANPDDGLASMVKAPTDFDTTAAAQGYITVFLTSTDTYLEPWVYLAELRITITGPPDKVEKLPFELEILPAITPSDLIPVQTGICSLESCGAPTVVRG